MIRLSALIAAVTLQSCLRAEEWPQFRGPSGTGVTGAQDYPTQWNTGQNVRWSVILPQPGNGSAIVAQGKVLVCSAGDPKGLERSLLCFDAQTGKRLWTRSTRVPEEMPTHKTNRYGGSTPASD